MPKASASSTPTAPTQNVAASYEAALQELEVLVGQMESGQMPLDGLMAGYQRGAVLLQFCRGKLDAVEEQIRVLDQGVAKPWGAQ